MALKNFEIKDLIENPSRIVKLDPKYREYVIGRIKRALDVEDEVNENKKVNTEIAENLHSENVALYNRYKAFSPPKTYMPTTELDIANLIIHSMMEAVVQFNDPNAVEVIKNINELLKTLCLLKTGGSTCPFCKMDCPVRKKFDENDKKEFINQLGMNDQDIKDAIWE